MQARGDADAGAASGLDQWARGALGSLLALPGVARAGVALMEGNGRRLRFTASDRAADGRVEWCHIDAYEDVPLTTAVRTGRAVVASLEDLEQQYGEFVRAQRQGDTAAVAAVPMLDGPRVLGAYVLFFEEDARLDEPLLDALGRTADDLAFQIRDVRLAGLRPPAPWPEGALPPGAVSALHVVGDDVAEVPAARRFLRRRLQGWGVTEDAAFTAALCLTELVTNAVIHSRGGCRVRAMLHQERLTITVRDEGGSHATGVPAREPLRVTGRGLDLVEALTVDWGTTTDADGTTVWCVLDV